MDIDAGRNEIVSWPRYTSRCREIDVNRFADFQKQIARVLHPPLRIGDCEVKGRGPVIGRHLYFRGHRQFMIRSVNIESSMDLH